jgi:DNA-binding transcriptional LysR family regulator
MKCLEERAPKTKLNLVAYGARDEAISLLDAGECQVAVGVPPSSAPGRIFTKPIFQEPFVCAVRRGHPAVGETLDLDTFLSLGHLLVSPEGDLFGHTDAVLAKNGLKRRLALTVSHMYPAPAVIAGSDLIATLMLGVIQLSGWSDKLTWFPPPFELEPCPYVMIWHRRNNAHTAQRWLRRCIETIC